MTSTDPLRPRHRRRRRPLLLAAAAVALAVGGCLYLLLGHHTAAPATSVDVTSARALAAALDRGGYACTRWAPNPDLQLGREGGDCRHGPGSITITTYSTVDQQKAVKKVIDASGLASGWSVSGDRWLVSGAVTRADADRIARILGGTVNDR